MYLKYITFSNYEQQTIMLLRHRTTMFVSLKNSEDQTFNSVVLPKGEKQPKYANYPLLLISTGRKDVEE